MIFKENLYVFNLIYYKIKSKLVFYIVKQTAVHKMWYMKLSGYVWVINSYILLYDYEYYFIVTSFLCLLFTVDVWFGATVCDSVLYDLWRKISKEKLYLVVDAIEDTKLCLVQ